jgi:hypothetical protein
MKENLFSAEMQNENFVENINNNYLLVGYLTTLSLS